MPSYDNSAGGFTNLNAGGNATVSFTVGNNLNRVILIFLSNPNSGNALSATYGGVTPTVISTAGLGGAYCAYLVAPTVGANNLVITGGANETNVAYAIWSFYGAAQTGQPDNSPPIQTTQ